MTSQTHAAVSRTKPRQSDDVADTIRSMIVDFTLPPGSVVSETQLMRRLGVVAGLDISDFALVAQCQQAIEPFAARMAAARITVGDVAELESILAQTRIALDDGNLEARRGRRTGARALS